MDEERARQILGSKIDAKGLFDSGQYVSWILGSEQVVLDAEFTADELEAIAWWMRNAKAPEPHSPA